MDDTRKDQDVSVRFVALIEHLAERLGSPGHTFFHIDAILAIIEDAVRAERDRCMSAWVETTVRPSTESESLDEDLPF